MDRREMVVSNNMNKKELILSTILKVYAIREAIEKRADENAFAGVPLLGGIALRLSSIALSKDQLKDISAFVTASCPAGDVLRMMEQITGFKARMSVDEPLKVWLSYVGLLLPILLAIAAEWYMLYAGLIVEIPYFLLAFVIVVLAVACSIVLYAYIGYDPSYRRDTTEKAIWKALNDECKRKMKRNDSARQA
ncbi:MAG TPA: hypothetical protein VGK13_04700, partial [Methanocellaceae archaeon]